MKALELTVYPKFDHDWNIDKRLTDAELAAEWQQAQRHMAVAVICVQPGAVAEIRRAEIMHRFATLPHYDEVTV